MERSSFRQSQDCVHWTPVYKRCKFILNLSFWKRSHLFVLLTGQ